MPLPQVQESRRPRAGRRFQPVAELELTNDALRAIRTLPGARSGVRVYREIAGPFGVPDFVATIGPPAPLRSRGQLAVPPLLNEIDAGIVAHASARTGTTVEALAAALSWPQRTIERRLTPLLRAGALRKTRSGRLLRPTALAPIGRLYAIETKIRDWRRALRQARTYGLWCDNYVIVMDPLSDSAMSSLVEAVRRDRGGLVVAGGWIERPRAREVPKAPRLWGSEHIVASVLRDGSPAFGGGV